MAAPVSVALDLHTLFPLYGFGDSRIIPSRKYFRPLGKKVKVASRSEVGDPPAPRPGSAVSAVLALFPFRQTPCAVGVGVASASPDCKRRENPPAVHPWVVLLQLCSTTPGRRSPHQSAFTSRCSILQTCPPSRWLGLSAQFQRVWANAGVPTPTGCSRTPAGHPTIPLDSDAVCPEMGSDPTG